MLAAIFLASQLHFLANKHAVLAWLLRLLASKLHIFA
jgi:hypothetical protein